MNKEEHSLRVKMLIDVSTQFDKGLNGLERYSEKFGRDGFTHSVFELITAGANSLRGSIDALTHFVIEDEQEAQEAAGEIPLELGTLMPEALTRARETLRRTWRHPQVIPNDFVAIPEPEPQHDNEDEDRIRW